MLKTVKKRFKLDHINTDLITFYFYKTIYQKIALRSNNHKTLLFIVGCQRSGTSLMTRIFFRDVRAKVYRESSVLSSKDPCKLRLDPLPQVEQKISSDKAPLLILKPLVESQNIIELLEYFSKSYAIWLFRHYKDVASSNLKIFGISNGINDLIPIVENDPNDWRSEKVTPFTRSIINKFFNNELSKVDAAALFWFARNQIYYDLNLDKNPKVLMCCYEDLVKNPNAVINNIYRKIGLGYPINNVTKEIHRRSVKKGWSVSLSPEIEEICSELLKRLETSYSEKLTHQNEIQ